MKNIAISFAVLFVGCLPLNATASEFPVMGANGGGKIDNTSAFQKALDLAGKSGGGTVSVPGGNYFFAGHLSIPDNVALEGSWKSVPAHAGMRDPGSPKPTDGGTTFLVSENRGNENGTPFITLHNNSTLKGIVLYYPKQDANEEPKPYPWTIAMRGMNPAVIDVELLNPYNGIDASRNERHLIRNVDGQPLRRGIYVDDVYDVGRMENVHFNPWWSASKKVLAWQQTNGEAFIFGRSDWQYALNTFCWGYKIGYKFVRTKAGVCNGNFLGLGADACSTAVCVEDCAKYGVLISNGEFVSFPGPDPTMVEVTPANTGSLRFANCAFWGPCNQIGKISGRGTTGFSDCTFVSWDRNNEGRPALKADSGTLLVRGCEFQEDKADVELGADSLRAVIADNVITGKLRVLNNGKGSVQIMNNASE